MTKGRLLAFSDGVIAILITIMVLDLGKPDGVTWHALRGELPVLLAYLLSFAFLGVYWNNHHHLFAPVHRVSGAVLWANLNLLFWLSLIPFVTSWMSENGFPTVPVAVYGIVLLACGVSFLIVLRTLLIIEGRDSVLAEGVGNNLKGKISPALYVLGIVFSFVDPYAGIAFYIAVALMWLIPDRGIERAVTTREMAEPVE